MPCSWCKRGAPAIAFAATAFSAVLSAAAPAAAQFDAEVMQKWATVTVVHYTVTGTFSANTLVVAAGTSGLADVADRVEIGFDYDQTAAKLVGEASIVNFPSTFASLRNGAEGCTPPTLHGAYEHFTLVSLKEGLGGQLEMTAQRDFPAADMPRMCSGGTEAVAARSVTEVETFVVPGVMILAMPIEPSNSLTVSADRTSLTQVDKGWTWTYVPTPVR